MVESLRGMALARKLVGLGMVELLLVRSIIQLSCHPLRGHWVAKQILARDNDVLLIEGLMIVADTVVAETLILATRSMSDATCARDPRT